MYVPKPNKTVSIGVVSIRLTNCKARYQTRECMKDTKDTIERDKSRSVNMQTSEVDRKKTVP